MLKICCLLIACLFPLSAQDFTRAIETVEKQASSEAASADGANRARIKAELEEFHQRFNKVLDAMKDFSAEYNSGKGNVWPIAKATKLDAAMRELQKNRYWSQYTLKPKAKEHAELLHE